MSRKQVLAARASWVLVALVALSACRRAEKRTLRTEPWLASAASASAASGVGHATYSVDRGQVTIDLRVNGKPVRATLSSVSGGLDVDFREPEKTRGVIRADLESLAFDDADFTAHALERLGLGARRPLPEPGAAVGQSLDHRTAELAITAIRGDSRPSNGTNRRRSVSAQANLTLHRFRAPVLLELELEFGEVDAGVPGVITVRTRRPFTISLAAHGLASEAPGTHPSPRFSPLPTVAKEARISAEIVASPASPNDSP